MDACLGLAPLSMPISLSVSTYASWHVTSRKETAKRNVLLVWNLQCRTVFDASLSAQCISSIGQIIQVVGMRFRRRETARRGDFKGWVTLRLNFWLKDYVPANIYGPLDGAMVILQLCCWKFSHKKTFVQTLLDWNWSLLKNKKSLLSHPLGDSGVTCTLQFVGKPVVDFLFVIIELISLSLTVQTL